MMIQTNHGVARVNLPKTIGSHLRNAGFKEEIIGEIVEALEWKSEFEEYKEELGTKTP